MPPKGYDRFMIETAIGTNRKVRRMPVPQRWCFVAGILALAAESPVRGWLLVSERVPATEQDIADHASVTPAVVRATIVSLDAMDIIAWDEDLGCWCLPKWEEFNPDPKFARSDPTAADRQRRRRDKLKVLRATSRDASPVTSRDGAVTPSREVEVEEEVKDLAGGAMSESGEGNPPLADLSVDEWGKAA